jgi:hypothetical protein
MSNLISWGTVYCETWWGDTDRTTLSIQNDSAPLASHLSMTLLLRFKSVLRLMEAY